ncbi:J domain-containing protein [Alicycliphilus sp. T452]
MPAPSRNAPIHIGAADSAAPLSPQQKKFNTQVQRIAAQRELLTAWDEAATACRARHASEYAPLLATHHALLCELAQWLDTDASPRKLSKADRATLGEAIAALAAGLADSARDEATRAAMKALYNRYAQADFDAGQAEAEEAARTLARTMAQEVFGLDLEGVDLDSPEDIARHVDEQMRERQAQAERAREAHQAERRRKKPGARERKAQEEARQASQSVREIYRKLASSLHPDRETDPAERQRKTALMQRVNQAYAANRLLDLLQLQLEAEQIDPAHIASLGEERLKHYNRVLAEQLGELQREVRAVEDGLCEEFGLDPWRRHKPAKLMGHLRAGIQYLQADIQHLRQQIRTLRDDPAELKPWLKEQRAALREQDDFPGDLLDLMGR